jgi:hypothetical protein
MKDFVKTITFTPVIKGINKDGEEKTIYYHSAIVYGYADYVENNFNLFKKLLHIIKSTFFNKYYFLKDINFLRKLLCEIITVDHAVKSKDLHSMVLSLEEDKYYTDNYYGYDYEQVMKRNPDNYNKENHCNFYGLIK